MIEIKNNWTKEEISEIYHSPLLDLIYRAATVHRENEDYSEVQISSLLSIRPGAARKIAHIVRKRRAFIQIWKSRP